MAHTPWVDQATPSELARRKLWNQPAIDYVNYHDYGGARQVDQTQFDLYWEPLTRAAASKKPPSENG